MTGGEIILGIDLGTTFSLVAVADERGPRVLRDDNGDGRVPSVIAIEPSESGPPRATVGWEARRHAVENPLATVYSVKRLIGRSYDEIVEDIPVLAYAVAPGPRETVQIEIAGRRHTPEELSAVILRELRHRAERQLGRPIGKAVITVPAYFDDTQRQATRDAGAAAGLEVVRILNEPTAAALAYGLGLRGRKSGDVDIQDEAGGPAARSSGHRPLPLGKCRQSDDVDDVSGEGDPIAGAVAQTVAVYDLGGGTFDISVLRIEDGVFQVLATAGDTRLGGDDFDRVLIDLVQRETRESLGVSIDSPATRQALRLLAESVKIRLGEAASATIELDLGGGRVFRREITRGEFEALIAPRVDRTIQLLRQAVADAGVAIPDLSQVILVGGSTRVPLVRSAVERAIGRKPYTALDPDEVVAVGAAVQAALLATRPATDRAVFAGGAAVAGGAAEGEAAGLAGGALNMLLLDVTPLSLGVETMGGAVGKLILRNTTIPCRASEMFTTFVDGQTAIRVRVLQGERELARDCRELAVFELRGIPPMPAGIPKVEIEFLIDASGILNVAARETRSGVAAGVQVVPSRGLTRDEVTRMLHESVQHGRDDLNEHRRIDLVNQVEFDTHKTLQMLARVGDRLPPGERERIEAEIESLRALARDSRDLDALHQALDRFGRGTIRLAELGIAAALRP